MFWLWSPLECSWNSNANNSGQSLLHKSIEEISYRNLFSVPLNWKPLTFFLSQWTPLRNWWQLRALPLFQGKTHINTLSAFNFKGTSGELFVESLGSRNSRLMIPDRNDSFKPFALVSKNMTVPRLVLPPWRVVLNLLPKCALEIREEGLYAE